MLAVAKIRSSSHRLSARCNFFQLPARVSCPAHMRDVALKQVTYYTEGLHLRRNLAMYRQFYLIHSSTHDPITFLVISDLCGSSERSERARDKGLRYPPFAMILLRRTGALCYLSPTQPFNYSTTQLISYSLSSLFHLFYCFSLLLCLCFPLPSSICSISSPSALISLIPAFPSPID